MTRFVFWIPRHRGNCSSFIARHRMLALPLVALALLLSIPIGAQAQVTVSDMGYYRVGTLNYFNQSFPGCVAFSTSCTAPNCADFGTTDGGLVNTSDLTVGDYVYIAGAADGEAYAFEAVAPDGSIWGKNTLTYTASNGCFAWSGNTSDWAMADPPNLGGGGFTMCTGGYMYVWSGPTLPCYANGSALAGGWTLEVFDSGSATSNTPVITHTFSLQHNANSQLGITSPIFEDPNQNNALVDNLLVDLAADQSYTATDTSCPAPVSAQGRETAACFSATTSSGNAITLDSQLNYSTSGGYGAIADPNGAFLSFITNSGDYYENHQYSS
jgi:hypothetical protein